MAISATASSRLVFPCALFPRMRLMPSQKLTSARSTLRKSRSETDRQIINYARMGSRKKNSEAFSHSSAGMMYSGARAELILIMTLSPLQARSASIR